MSKLEWSHDEECWSRLGEDCDCLFAPFKKLKGAVTEFEDADPIELLRLCAKTLEDCNWTNDIRLARANWLRRFASHLEEVRKP